jgi:hypothetical protein
LGAIHLTSSPRRSDRFAIGALLPKVSYLTRLDHFIPGSTLLVFGSPLEVVVTTATARLRSRSLHLPPRTPAAGFRREPASLVS